MQDNQIPVAPILLALFLIVGFFLFILMVAFIGFLIFRASKRRAYDKVRGSEVQSAATQLGFSFTPQAQINSLPFLQNVKVSDNQPDRLENLITGQIGIDQATVFDLVFLAATGQRGSGAITHRQTTFVIEAHELDLPAFELRPEGFLDKALESDDIDFPHRPEFSRKFLLRGKDERAVRHIFNDQILDFCEKYPATCLFGAGKFLSLHQSRFLVPPQQIKNYLELMKSIRDIFRRE